LAKGIRKRVISEKTRDYEELVAWMEEAITYNGFYILGI